MPAQHSINLLSQDEFEKTALGKFLKWALSFGRYIVIGTELVVILSFLSRFKLDRDLTDLYEEIEQKQIIIESSKEFEDEFRTAQQDIKTVKLLENQQLRIDKLLKYLDSLTPSEVKISSLVIANDTLQLEAKTPSENLYNQMVQNFKTSDKFSKVNINKVSWQEKEGGNIEFSLKAIFSPI
jgi:Tfp pilus assembly protein PilN